MRAAFVELGRAVAGLSIWPLDGDDQTWLFLVFAAVVIIGLTSGLGLLALPAGLASAIEAFALRWVIICLAREAVR